MRDAAPDAHVHLSLHPQHPSAVVATLTGTELHTARATLASEGFRPVSDDTMLLIRIDHEEPNYANITDQLQEEIDADWTWANHPMTWPDSDEIRGKYGENCHELPSSDGCCGAATTRPA